MKKRKLTLLFGSLLFVPGLLLTACGSNPAGDSSSSEQIVVNYAVSFNPNGGSGSMADVVAASGEYTLPECLFIAPDGYEFDAWEVKGVKKNAGDKIEISSNLVIKALWKEIVLPPVDQHIYLSRHFASDLDSDDYDEEFANNVSKFIYAGTLLNNENPNLFVDLTLDPETMTYKLEKDTFRNEPVSKGKTVEEVDGFEFYVTFEGEYVDNEDGSYVLQVPTKATRYWFVSQLFAGYFDQYGAMLGAGIPGVAKPSDYLTVEPVYGTTQAVDADGEPVWVKDDAGHELYQDAEAHKYYKVVEGEGDEAVTTWFNEDGTEVGEGFNPESVSQIPQYAVESFNPKPTTNETDDKIIDYWFNGITGLYTGAAQPQIVYAGEDGEILGIETEPKEYASILFDGIDHKAYVKIDGEEVSASFDPETLAFEEGKDAFSLVKGTGRNPSYTLTYSAEEMDYKVTISQNNFGLISNYFVNNVNSSSAVINAKTGDEATHTVNGTIALNGLNIDWVVKDNKVDSLSLTSSVKNKEIYLAVTSRNGVNYIEHTANGVPAIYEISDAQIIKAAFNKFPECEALEVAPSTFVVDRTNGTIKGHVGETRVDTTYSVEAGVVTIADEKLTFANNTFTYRDGDLYTKLACNVSLLSGDGVALVVAADDSEVSRDGIVVTMSEDKLKDTTFGGQLMNHDYTLSADAFTLNIADRGTVSVENGVATISYQFAMAAYGIDINFTAVFALADAASAYYSPAI